MSFNKKQMSHQHTLHELNISFSNLQNNIHPKLTEGSNFQTSTKWRVLAPSPNNSSRCPVPRQFCTARRCKSNCCCQCCHSDSGAAARTWTRARFQDLLARFQVGFNGYFGLDQVIFGKIHKKSLHESSSSEKWMSSNSNSRYLARIRPFSTNIQERRKILKAQNDPLLFKALTLTSLTHLPKLRVVTWVKLPLPGCNSSQNIAPTSHHMFEPMEKKMILGDPMAYFKRHLV